MAKWRVNEDLVKDLREFRNKNPKCMFPADLVRRVVKEMYLGDKSGSARSKTAKALGLSFWTVRNWMKKHPEMKVDAAFTRLVVDSSESASLYLELPNGIKVCGLTLQTIGPAIEILTTLSRRLHDSPS